MSKYKTLIRKFQVILNFSKLPIKSCPIPIRNLWNGQSLSEEPSPFTEVASKKY